MEELLKQLRAKLIEREQCTITIQRLDVDIREIALRIKIQNKYAMDSGIDSDTGAEVKAKR